MMHKTHFRLLLMIDKKQRYFHEKNCFADCNAIFNRMQLV